MSIPAKIKLCGDGIDNTVSGKIALAPDRAALSFSLDGDDFLVVITEKRMRVKKTGELSYDMLFRKDMLSPVTIKTAQGTLSDIYMTTHSLEAAREGEHLFARAVYSFDSSPERKEITLECVFYEN